MDGPDSCSLWDGGLNFDDLQLESKLRKMPRLPTQLAAPPPGQAGALGRPYPGDVASAARQRGVEGMDTNTEIAAAVLPGIAFLAATSLLVPTFRKAGMSAIMAFLCIGILMGPNVLGLLSQDVPWTQLVVLDPDGPAHWLAELGVVFLLFSIGLEVSTERLWALRKMVLGLGLSQVVITACVVLGIALAFANPFPVAIVIGLAFALSSTAVVLQLLAERRQLSGTVGRAAFSILLLQDLAVIPILLVTAALGAGPAAGNGGAGGVLAAIGLAFAAIAAILISGRFLARPLFRWVSSVDRREVFVAAVLFVVVAAAMAAEAAGLSMALGAFLAGLLLAETEFRHEIEADIEPFKGLLLGLFFVTVGMQIDLGQLSAAPLQVLAGVVGLLAVKAAILIPLARGFGLSWPHAIEMGFLLAQAGEFAFVIISTASQGGAFPSETADYMLLVVAVSLFLTPVSAALGATLARRLTRNAASTIQPADADVSGHVIVAGYGRFGEALGALLQQQEIAHIALDTDVRLVNTLRKRGWPLHYGDASRKDVLATLGADKAAAIIVTMNNPEAVEHIVASARAAWPHVPIFARARDPVQASRLHAAGAHFANPETIEAMLQLGDALLNRLGVPDETVRRAVDELRQSELRKSRATR